MSETGLTWPSRPTCHDGEQHILGGEADVWDPPVLDPGDVDSGRFYRDQPYRSCSYCNSMHPEDLIEALVRKGARLGGADWKYSYPHKFYVLDLPTGLPDIPAVTSGYSRPVMNDAGEVIDRESHYSTGFVRHSHAKWYNCHFKDAGYSEEALRLLMGIIAERSGISFRFDEEGGACWTAPYFGYQR